MEGSCLAFVHYLVQNLLGSPGHRLPMPSLDLLGGRTGLADTLSLSISSKAWEGSLETRRSLLQDIFIFIALLRLGFGLRVYQGSTLRFTA